MPRFRTHDEFCEVYRRLGERIAEERARRGLSQRDLAELTGTTQSAVSRLEGGGRVPRLDTLLRVANALDCALEVNLRPRTTIERRSTDDGEC
ncbi:MAG: helix-turn-helix transcriptional regulator [Actinobacteria bacterium]|nr:helix-turn-helix transcriptional regulator [Actinomycetota bacterium]